MCIGTEPTEASGAGRHKPVAPVASASWLLFPAAAALCLLALAAWRGFAHGEVLKGLAAILPLLLLALRPQQSQDENCDGEAADGGGHRNGLLGAEAEAAPPYADPLRYCFLPPDGLGARDANGPQAETIDNDLCVGKTHAMHRPTHEPWREVTGEYPFAWHLLGRKRLWEIRLQLRFKKQPQSRIYFGITLDGYTPNSRAGAQVQKALFAACKRILGDVYHSPGDDPATTVGEVEPPTFVMPLWAFDQFIVSEPGEEPNLLRDLDQVGHRRTDGLADYCRAMREVSENLSTDKVYTFCFWGISQFLDCMRWEVCGGVLPGFRMDFNKLAGTAPIHVSFYELPGLDENDSDQRHLPSRKKTYVEVAMWSERSPPPPEVRERLLGPAPAAADGGGGGRDRKSGIVRRSAFGAMSAAFGGSVVGNAINLFACCTGRDSRQSAPPPEAAAAAWRAAGPRTPPLNTPR